jgi:hypothetical protein
MKGLGRLFEVGVFHVSFPETEPGDLVVWINHQNFLEGFDSSVWHLFLQFDQR